MKAGNAGRPIRVLHLGNATGLYGAERWILALARHLPAGEAHSVVAALDDAGVESPALCEHAQRLGIPTQVFRSRGRLSLGAVTQLRDFVQRNGIDVVHTHGYKTDLVACLAAGMNAHATKPIVPEELFARLADCLPSSPLSPAD